MALLVHSESSYESGQVEFMKSVGGNRLDKKTYKFNPRVTDETKPSPGIHLMSFHDGGGDSHFSDISRLPSYINEQVDQKGMGTNNMGPFELSSENNSRQSHQPYIDWNQPTLSLYSSQTDDPKSWNNPYSPLSEDAPTSNPSYKDHYSSSNKFGISNSGSSDKFAAFNDLVNKIVDDESSELPFSPLFNRGEESPSLATSDVFSLDESPSFNGGSVWSTGSESTPSGKSDKNSVSYGSFEQQSSHLSQLWDDNASDSPFSTYFNPHSQNQSQSDSNYFQDMVSKDQLSHQEDFNTSQSLFNDHDSAHLRDKLNFSSPINQFDTFNKMSSLQTVKNNLPCNQYMTHAGSVSQLSLETQFSPTPKKPNLSEFYPAKQNVVTPTYSHINFPKNLNMNNRSFQNNQGKPRCFNPSSVRGPIHNYGTHQSQTVVNDTKNHFYSNIQNRDFMHPIHVNTQSPTMPLTNNNWSNPSTPSSGERSVNGLDKNGLTHQMNTLEQNLAGVHVSSPHLSRFLRKDQMPLDASTPQLVRDRIAAHLRAQGYYKRTRSSNYTSSPHCDRWSADTAGLDSSTNISTQDALPPELIPFYFEECRNDRQRIDPRHVVPLHPYLQVAPHLQPQSLFTPNPGALTVDGLDYVQFDPYSQIGPTLYDVPSQLLNLPYFYPGFRQYRRTGPSNELHVKLEKCYEQFKAVEKERKKTEAELARQNPGKKVSSANNIVIPRLPSNPSRVDRLIVDSFREHARIITLIDKMQRLRSITMHPNIQSCLEKWLEGIRKVQARRKEEIVNAANRHRAGIPRQQEDKDVLALATSICELTAHIKRARTATWCALQMADKSNPLIRENGIDLENPVNIKLFTIDPVELTATEVVSFKTSSEVAGS